MVRRAIDPRAATNRPNGAGGTGGKANHELGEQSSAPRRYTGTAPAITLAWVLAVALVVLCWLAYAYLHTVGPDQFPQASAAP